MFFRVGLFTLCECGFGLCMLTIVAMRGTKVWRFDWIWYLRVFGCLAGLLVVFKLLIGFDLSIWCFDKL